MPRYATFFVIPGESQGVTQWIPRYRSTGQGGECPPSEAKGLLMRHRPEGSEGCLATLGRTGWGGYDKVEGCDRVDLLTFYFFLLYNNHVYHASKFNASKFNFYQKIPKNNRKKG
jgi:hypothetical protein